MLVLGPVTEYFIARSWTSTEPTSFLNEWSKHIRNGQVLQENGPLWFCLALLLFSIAYALLSALRRKPVTRESGRPYVPSRRTLVCLALLIAVLTFLVRGARPPSYFNLPLKDFAQYVVMFSAGIFASRLRFSPDSDRSSGLGWLFSAFTLGFSIWLMLLVLGGAFRGQQAAFSSGWHWQNASFSLWESCTAVVLSYGLLLLSSKKCNRQGRVAQLLSANAFSVYVFHPPILILAARSLHPLAAPAVAKFLLLFTIAVAASFLLSAAVFRRIPGLRRIL